VIILAVLAALVTFARYWFLHADEVTPPELPGVLESGQLQFGGHSRDWLAYIPANVEPEPAVLLFFRGSGSDAAKARAGSFYSFDVLAERHGFIAVYPTGYEKHWNGCRASASYAANLESIDDVGFVRALVEQLSERYGIDESRVFAAGMSNGGHMVYRLAYEAPELLAGAASVMANLPTAENSDCKPAGLPVPMLVISGTKDPINPYEGGEVDVYGESRGAVQSTLASARYWAKLAGHSGEGELRQWPQKAPDDGTSLESRRWESPGKTTVALISVVGGGHTFPNPVFAAPRILSASSHEADAAELIWTFFDQL
jgi:polyhydroxybutyrate depolymerase